MTLECGLIRYRGLISICLRRIWREILHYPITVLVFFSSAT